MPNNVVIVRLEKVILDVFLLNCVGWPILFLYLWGIAFKRGFFCNDTSLMHPYNESTVPSWTLYITGIGLNCTVIEADFKQIFPGKELLLLNRWNLFFNRALEIKSNEIKNSRDPILQNLLTILEEDSKNLSEDSKVALQIASLPRIVPPKGRAKVGKEHWKFNTTEAVEGILVHCCMLLIEYLNRPSDNREIYFLGMRIPNWMYNIYCMIGMFAFGAACSQLTTDVMKYTIGRLRPHFINVCQPDVCNSSYPPTLVYHEKFTCTNPLYVNNTRIMKELRLSFPSGHSSFSMYTMVYFAIYLQKRMTWDGSKLLKHSLQFLAVLQAVFTAMTRVSDYKHHWSDVLVGLLLGATVAIVNGRFFSTLFDNSSATNLKRDQSELRSLNGNGAHSV